MNKFTIFTTLYIYNGSIPDRLVSMWQRVNSVSAHPVLIVEIDERQLHLTKCVDAVRVRALRVRLDKCSLAVEDAVAITIMRQL